MYRLLLLFICLPLFACARVPDTLTITSDSLSATGRALKLRDGWRFRKGDSALFANPAFNDSAWAVIKGEIREDSELKHKPGFSRVDWYRLHFRIDSAAAGIPLVLYLSGYGACEVYLDGKKIHSIGVIAQPGNKYFAAKTVPGIFVIGSAGAHVLAVRFANFAGKNFLKDEDYFLTGFDLSIGRVENAFINGNKAVITNVTLLVFLCASFLVLAIIHLLLFLYYRSVRSNLYFSCFCFSLCALFTLLYLDSYCPDPAILLQYADWAAPITAAVGFLSFSGLNNELFGRKKLRFAVVVALCAACILINFFYSDVAGYLYAGTGVLVLTEGLVLPVIGMYRKVKGARIVAAGVLFFAVFIVFFICMIFARHELTVSSDSFWGGIVLLLGACAIFSIPVSMSVYLSWNFAAMNKDLKKNLQQVQELSQQKIEQEMEKQRIIEGQKERLEVEVAARTNEVIAQKEKIERQHEELKIEKQKSDELLLNILPAEVADELKQKGSSEARFFDDVTVLFTDFVNFTIAGEEMAPQALVNELNICFKAFDEIISRHGIEKIKTIGDAYLGVCGLPLPVESHASKTVAAALEIAGFMAQRRARLGDKTFEVRIGIHSGSVVAGIVGLKKFAYDVWGDTVNTAARIEQNSQPGKVNISQSTYERVSGEFDCQYRGKITAKNKGELNMYFVEGVRANKATASDSLTG